MHRHLRQGRTIHIESWFTGLVVMALATAGAACAPASTDTERPATWDLESPVDAGSTTVSLQVFGGGCHADAEQLTRVDVDTADDHVTLTPFIRKPPVEEGQVCPAIGRVHRTTVELDAALGDRVLVDGGCQARQEPSCVRWPD